VLRWLLPFFVAVSQTLFAAHLAALFSVAVHGLQPVVDNNHMDVSDLVTLTADTSKSEELIGVTNSARASAVRGWLRAEDDAAAADQTVDMILASMDRDE